MTRMRPLALPLLAALAAPAARAELPLGKAGGTTLGFEGLLQADATWFDNDLAALGASPESALRRAELVLKAKGPGGLEGVVGYDAKSRKWLDVNLKSKLAGGQSLQLGQFKQPLGLEELTSTKHNDFISKAAATNTFAVSRRLGAAYAVAGKGWGATASAFSRELTRDGAVGAGFALRGSWAPLHGNGRTLHLGLAHAGYHAELPGNPDAQRWRARPQADLAAARLVDTGTLANADRVGTTGLEAMWLQGPLKLQGEFMRGNTRRYAGLPDFTAHGAYASAVWNATGEAWGYKNGLPAVPAAAAPDAGMLQLGLRYDTVDLDDGPVRGGHMDAWTIGANYYWQANVKLALNYVKADSRKYHASTGAEVRDAPDMVELRAQLHW